jgi:type II secretory pathway pseudopilin PulG
VKTRKNARGFTLVEVTLAIVIGIIMIAGATLIYNQAKVSAGNSRAQAKVASLQSLIEQYMARADGLPPDVIALRALWQRARPDDFDKSPWGGVCSPCSPTALQSGVPARGILDGSALTPDGQEMNTTAVLGGNGQSTGGPRGPNDGQASFTGAPTGVMIFYRWPSAGNFGVWDEGKRSAVWGKTYSVSTTNQRGERWFFVRTNSSGTSEQNSAATGLGGVIRE